jgi:tetratricopeptide (TPR) repeat protein
MTGTEGPPVADPLRNARQAVRGGRFREAREALGRLEPDEQQSAEAQLLSAMASWRLADYTASRAAAERARTQFRAIGDTDGEMRALNVAAAGAFAVGDLKAAEHGFNDALALADRLENKLMTAHCANNLGNVAYFLERHYVALGLYRLAGATFEGIGADPGLIMTWINAAVVWTELDDLDKAREASEHAVEIAERAQNRRLAGAALTAQAEAVAGQGDFSLGHAQASRGLVLARAEGDRPGEAEALRVLARITRETVEPDRAEDLARGAVAVAAELGDRWRAAEAHRELAELYVSLGRTREAQEELEASAEAFAALGATHRAARERKRAGQLETR